MLYDAAKQAMLDAVDPLNPEFIHLYRDVERPCRHSRIRRLYDRLRGRYHGRTHVATEGLIRAALVELIDADRIRVTWDSKGIISLE